MTRKNTTRALAICVSVAIVCAVTLTLRIVDMRVEGTPSKSDSILANQVLDLSRNELHGKLGAPDLASPDGKYDCWRLQSRPSTASMMFDHRLYLVIHYNNSGVSNRAELNEID